MVAGFFIMDTIDRNIAVVISTRIVAMRMFFRIAATTREMIRGVRFLTDGRRPLRALVAIGVIAYGLATIPALQMLLVLLVTTLPLVVRWVTARPPVLPNILVMGLLVAARRGTVVQEILHPPPIGMRAATFLVEITGTLPLHPAFHRLVLILPRLRFFAPALPWLLWHPEAPRRRGARNLLLLHRRTVRS